MMSWSGIRAISLRIIRQFRRDHRTLALLFIVPIVILSLLGPLVDTEATIRLGVDNRDAGVAIPSPPGRPATVRRLSKPLINSLEKGSHLKVRHLSRRAIDREIRDGNIDGALEIDADFSRETQKQKRPRIKIVLEGSDPSINRDLIGQVRKRLATVAAAQAPRISVTYTYGGSDLKTLDYFAPVFIAFFVFFIVFLLTSVSFLRERGQGTIERLMASPVNGFEIIVGYLLGFFVFAAIQSAVILFYTVLVLKVKFAGALWEIFLIELLLTVGSVNLGIFLSSFARTELQVVQFIPIVITPQALLSGMIWPVRAMPYYLRWLAAIMPLTYANIALRATMIKGLSLAAVKPEITFLVIFALVMMVLSMLTIQRNVV